MVAIVSSVILVAVVNAAPRASLLEPSPKYSLDPKTFLAAESPAEKPKTHFSPGWLVAGILGGAATGAIIGTAVGTRWCQDVPGSPGKGAAIAGVYLSLGSLFGYAAATDHPWGRTATILIDTVGPAVGTVALLTAGLPCAH